MLFRSLHLNPKKTEVIIFTRKKAEVNLSDFVLDGQPIELGSMVKYLGVTLDDELTYKQHVVNKAKSTKKRIFMVRNYVYKHWGPSPKIMRKVYMSVIKPSLDYGCHIWQHKQGKATELLQVQRTALLTLAPTWNSMPTKGLQVIWNIPPIHLHLERVANNTYARIRNKVEHTHKGYEKGYYGHLDVLKQAYQYAGHIVDKVKRRAKQRLYTIEIKGNKGKVTIPNPTPNEIHVYTDGSKLNGLAGCGVHIQGKEDICKH